MEVNLELYCVIQFVIYKLINYKIIQSFMSTAVEQVVPCALVTQRARVRSLVGTGFLGEVFFGVFPHL